MPVRNAVFFYCQKYGLCSSYSPRYMDARAFHRGKVDYTDRYWRKLSLGWTHCTWSQIFLGSLIIKKTTTNKATTTSSSTTINYLNSLFGRPLDYHSKVHCFDSQDEQLDSLWPKMLSVSFQVEKWPETCEKMVNTGHNTSRNMVWITGCCYNYNTLEMALT